MGKRERQSLVGGAYAPLEEGDRHDTHLSSAFEPKGLTGVAAASGSPADDGFSVLAADDYFALRINPATVQLKRLARTHAWALTTLQTLIFIDTLCNAMLAVLKQDVFMPVVVAFITSVKAI